MSEFSSLPLRKILFFHTTLRYIPNQIREEFQNVGVVIFNTFTGKTSCMLKGNTVVSNEADHTMIKEVYEYFANGSFKNQEEFIRTINSFQGGLVFSTPYGAIDSDNDKLLKYFYNLFVA